jgi:hypothetical protein
MKKLTIILVLVLFAAAGCKEQKPADYTRLGFYTPYQTYMEKLNGKVESVTEKGYWAIPEGESYIKGARITRAELDSIGYTYDYKVVFDADGDLVSTTTFDENEDVIDIWSMMKENNCTVRAEYKSDDTVRYYHLITCDAEGNPWLYEYYNALTDTLVRKDEVKGFETNDTTVWQYYNYKGEPGARFLLVFNDLGLLTTWQTTLKDGTAGSSYTLTYNEMGFQNEATFYDKDKNITAKTLSSYEYDDKGNWIKVICKDDKGFAVIGERVYTYFD